MRCSLKIRVGDCGCVTVLLTFIQATAHPPSPARRWVLSEEHVRVGRDEHNRLAITDGGALFRVERRNKSTICLPDNDVSTHTLVWLMQKTSHRVRLCLGGAKVRGRRGEGNGAHGAHFSLSLLRRLTNAGHGLTQAAASLVSFFGGLEFMQTFFWLSTVARKPSYLSLHLACR